MSKREIGDYLQDILDHIAIAEKFVRGITFEEFEEDEKTLFALVRALEIIGEAIKENIRSYTSRTTGKRSST